MRLHYVRRLLGIQGYSIAKVTVEERRGRQAVALEPKRLRRSYECGKWQRKLKTAHSSWRIEFQHLLPLWQYPTFLRMRRFRVCWPQCGLNLEPLPFAADGPMVTCPLATLVHELCKVMTVQAAGTLMLLHRATVKTT